MHVLHASAAAMASTSNQKSSILSTNQQFNEALAARDSSALKATFADNILLHGGAGGTALQIICADLKKYRYHG